MLDMRHVCAHDELSQIVDRLLEGSNAILYLDRALESLNAVVEVAIDAVLFDCCLVAGLVSSSSCIVGRLLLNRQTECLHRALVRMRESVLRLRMLSVLGVDWRDRSDIGRCRRHRGHWRVVGSGFRSYTGSSNLLCKGLCKVANVLTSDESVWPVLTDKLQRL